MGGIRQRVAAASLSMLALGGMVCGAATTAQASDVAAGSAGPGRPGSIGGGTSVTATAHWATGVPWRSVGRGWILADLAQSQSPGAPATVYLVSPGGHRYRLGPAPAGATLEDWSGNGTNALFFAENQNSTTGLIIVLNLHTGRASRFSTFSSEPFPGISFTRPDGKAILFQAGTTQDGASLPLQRFSLALHVGRLVLPDPVREGRGSGRRIPGERGRHRARVRHPERPGGRIQRRRSPSGPSRSTRRTRATC